MVANFKVFKKVSPNGKVTVYLGKRDIVDHVTAIEPIDGVVVVDTSYLADRKLFGQVVCSFRYGREEDEVMGLSFQKDLHLCSVQIYPQLEKPEFNLTKLQICTCAVAHQANVINFVLSLEFLNNLDIFASTGIEGLLATVVSVEDRLMKKLGPNAFPFTFKLPPNAPASITIQPGQNETGEPCGLQYLLKMFVGEHETDRSHRRSTVSLGIRKVQYAPSKCGRQPCTVVRKDFMLSPGELELEVVLDKQVYHHGERIAANICVRNNSNKMVKKIKAMVQQGVDVMLFQNGQYRTTIASLETDEGCPIQPGSSMQKIVYLTPELATNKDRRGIALDGQIKGESPTLASSTLFSCGDQKDIFGIVVSYAVKVKLYLGALSGELAAELPVIIMHPKPSKIPLLRADSQAEVETFRQDTIDVDTM